MRPRIRPFEDRDTEAVVGLSLRAWAPVFASLEQTLGSEIFRRQHPDWREDQRRAVEEVCATKKGRVWVTEAGASTTTPLAEIRLEGALPQPTALYGEVRDVPENHGVPGSIPGLATSFCSYFQGKRRGEGKPRLWIGAL